MQYAIHQSVIPPKLRARGARVWVGDTIVQTEVLCEQGLCAISVLMWRDVYGEIVILFALPEGSPVTPEEIGECRQCALAWISQWETSSQKSAPSLNAAASVRRKTQAKAASSASPRTRGVGGQTML